MNNQTLFKLSRGYFFLLQFPLSLSKYSEIQLGSLAEKSTICAIVNGAASSGKGWREACDIHKMLHHSSFSSDAFLHFGHQVT